MKLQVKQLDERSTNIIALALERYATYLDVINSPRTDMCLEMAASFRHCIFLQVSEGYDAPVDDVQVLGNEKGGQE